MTAAAPKGELHLLRGAYLLLQAVVIGLALLGVGLPLGDDLTLRLIDVLAAFIALHVGWRVLTRPDAAALATGVMSLVILAAAVLSNQSIVFPFRLAEVPLFAWYVYRSDSSCRVRLLWIGTVVGALNGMLALYEARLGADYSSVQRFQEQLAGWIPRDNPELVPLDQGLIRISAQYSFPNELGGVLALLVFLGVLLLMLSPRRVLVVVLLIAAIGGLYVTGSRASYLAVIGLGFVMVARAAGRSRHSVAEKALLIALTLVAAGVALGPTLLQRASSAGPSFVQRLTSAFTVADQATTPLRLETWRAAMSAIADHPVFGVGLEGLYRVVPATHNSFLFIYLSAGVLGFVGFTVWSVAVVRLGVRLVARAAMEDIVLGGSLLMASWLLLVEDRPGSPMFMALLAGLFGLALSWSSGRGRGSEAAPDSPSRAPLHPSPA